MFNGISNFTNNSCSALDLLQEQTLEFLINRSLFDEKKIMIDNLKIAPKVLENTLKFGIVKTISQLSTNQEIRKDLRNSLENFKEMLDLMKLTNGEDQVQSHQRKKCLKKFYIRNNFAFLNLAKGVYI